MHSAAALKKVTFKFGSIKLRNIHLIFPATASFCTFLLCIYAIGNLEGFLNLECE